MGFLNWAPVKATLQFGDRAANAVGIHDIPFVTNPYTTKSAPTPSPTPAPAPYKAATPAPVDNSFMQSLNAQIAALQRQLAYTPKLPSYDIMGNYNRARSTAEAAVNPLYDKYLRDFLAGQQSSKVAKTNQIANQKEATALDLSQTLAGNEVNRGRTAQDTVSSIEKLNTQEGQFQQASGTQNDQDRRALAEQQAAAGLTSTGIGQGVVYDQNNKRNLDESQQVQEYTNQRQAKKLFEARTFEDLARGDKDANAIATNKNKAADFDLEAYLTDLANNETQFRAENEYKRVSDVNAQSDTYARQGTQSFLASLAGAGWRPQDIALAYQVYG